jgi:hypothetical protein
MRPLVFAMVLTLPASTRAADPGDACETARVAFEVSLARGIDACTTRVQRHWPMAAAFWVDDDGHVSKRISPVIITTVYGPSVATCVVHVIEHAPFSAPACAGRRLEVERVYPLTR